MLYVMGVFDCGCSYESSFGSLDIVECKTKVEANKIINKMNKYSANSQCHGAPAMYTMVFEGKIVEKDNIKDKIGDQLEDKNLFTYEDYCKAWTKRGKENKKWKKRLENYDKEFPLKTDI